MAKKRTRLTKDNPDRKRRDIEVATLRLQGKSVREIGKEVGIGPSQVSSILSDSQIKEILDRVMRHYASHAESVGEEFLALCYDNDKHVKLKAIEGYQKIMGLIGTHTQNVFIQNLMVQENNFLQDEEFRKVAMAFLGLSLNGEESEENHLDSDTI